MLRLLHLELQKLLLNRTSKVLIFISFILPFFVILLSSLKINVFGFFTLELGELGIFNFPVIWHLTTFFASQFKFFFAIVVVSMIGNEYSNKTIKQNLIDGLSKKEFILSKFYAIIFFSLASTVLIGLISLCIGLYYSSYNEFNIIIRETSFLLAYLVKLIGFFSLCLFFGMLAKRSAFALAFLFILFILEWLGFGLLTWQFNMDVAESIQNFFPLKSMYKLIDQPFQRIAMTKFPDKGELMYDYAVHWYEIAIVLGWTALFIFLSYRLLKKRDL
ncbi:MULTISPECIES: ABC transporter permease [Aestuariibaculum]|uniref:ABC transporter permease subunit n=1 Tax=Aestuariibaculum marinum TaxID=2683592 RepID=A0A8J6PUL3_9FLAO|nr:MULTISPECIES: ABC transporter permease subunit [Aestuariibaculum]MBD0824060.1 ABC transporter permease subunit [Aestuariibaculum marinum]WMI65631.1 ABC transporter permease subunit [Aestuariibaculum sp. YM273]